MTMIGVPEVVILFVIFVVWLVPVAAGVWALLTLNRIAKAIDEIRAKIDQLPTAPPRV